jgi:UDP-3-O-[3-hydroxymyristoyl] glucosamine N-acyltransferase
MIHPSVKFGVGVIIDGVPYEAFKGYRVRRSGIEIGEGTVIMNNVEIRSGTKIGRNCYIDSGVKFSGECSIGDDVTLRYNTIIARGCIIGNGVYFAPNCMTNNLDSGQNKIGGATVGNNCFFGTGTVLQHGIFIAHDTTTGAMSFVSKDIRDPEGVYLGIPAKRKG